MFKGITCSSSSFLFNCKTLVSPVLCGSFDGVLKPGLGDGGINIAVLIELRLLVEEVADTGGKQTIKSHFIKASLF